MKRILQSNVDLTKKPYRSQNLQTIHPDKTLYNGCYARSLIIQIRLYSEPKDGTGKQTRQTKSANSLPKGVASCYYYKEQTFAKLFKRRADVRRSEGMESEHTLSEGFSRVALRVIQATPPTMHEAPCIVCVHADTPCQDQLFFIVRPRFEAFDFGNLDRIPVSGMVRGCGDCHLYQSPHCLRKGDFLPLLVYHADSAHG